MTRREQLLLRILGLVAIAMMSAVLFWAFLEHLGRLDQQYRQLRREHTQLVSRLADTGSSQANSTEQARSERRWPTAALLDSIALASRVQNRIESAGVNITDVRVVENQPQSVRLRFTLSSSINRILATLQSVTLELPQLATFSFSATFQTAGLYRVIWEVGLHVVP